MKKSRDQNITLTQFRLWKCNTDNLEEIQGWDSKFDYTQSIIDAEPCNIFEKEEDKLRKVEDLNFVDGAIFVIEVPKKKDEYTFKAMATSAECSPRSSTFEEESKGEAPAFDMKKMIDADLG